MPKTCPVTEQLELKIREAMNRKVGNSTKRYNRTTLTKDERDSAFDDGKYLENLRTTLRLHKGICDICSGR